MRFSLRSSGFRIAAIVAAIVLAVAATVSAQYLRTTHAAAGGVAPNAVNNMDCNGWSAKYKSVRPAMRALCTDPIMFVNGKATRLIDNGWYVGHDEPSVKFISAAPGSGNTMAYDMQLAVDPAAAPTADGSVTHYAELSSAPWFGLPICDPNSFPNGSCTPDSDANNPNAAGSAFMELQFYPPGFTPWFDSPSCDATHYCAALNIDSLEVMSNGQLNPNCVEPVNFAWLQMNGKPAGPPSPQLSDDSTVTPNAQTLMMNPGDTLHVSIQDGPNGLRTQVDDLTTGQSGFMTASAKNGFMNSDPNTCNGFPFDFHAEYNTAAQQNQVPWAALEGGVLMEDELGHFEPCTSVSNNLPINTTFADGQTFSDQSVFQTCNGTSEKRGAGETCTFTSKGVSCKSATAEGDTKCPTANPNSGALCEFSDAFCMPAGPRTVTNNGVAETVSWPVAGCEANAFQNGDLDFDGTPYRADWPDGNTAAHPTSFRYLGPFDAQGNPYPQIQFESNAAGSETNCNTTTGAGCTAPPLGPGNAPTFYPFWTIGNEAPLTSGTTTCVWNFGNTIAGQTTHGFGGDAEYGVPDVARYAGTLTSPVIANPQISLASGTC